MMQPSTFEEYRLKMQAEIDGKKTSAEKNVMGQFATPTALAHDIIAVAESLLPRCAKVSFLDPAFGTGSFYSALLDIFSKSRVEKAEGFEIDPRYGEPARSFWKSQGIGIQIADFTKTFPPKNEEGKFNLVICNPPYVRHHHIKEKEKVRLQKRIAERFGIRLSGLAGLYCYFLMLSVDWMSRDGIAGWLIPSEFMDVNYGRQLKKFLLEKVTLLHIHRFDPIKVQFGDALVSSAVVWFRNTSPPIKYSVEFSFDGSLTTPCLMKSIPKETLEKESKWTRFPASKARENIHSAVLADFFKIKRGLATGDNGFFILSMEQIAKRNLPMECFKPILPSPRFLMVDEIPHREDGVPEISNKLFLLDCQLSEKEIRELYPSLWEYLLEGKKKKVTEAYLCQNRKPWYLQEERPPSPFICTYIGRSDNGNRRPFRFILNHSKATVTNSYLVMYPKPTVDQAIMDNPRLVHEIWEALKTIPTATMLEEGRVYGGGLHKIEPRELGNVPAESLSRIMSKMVHNTKMSPLQLTVAF